jgi:two-component system NarL family response regulator
MSVRVLIADDHELVRKGLVSLLETTHPEWEIAGEAANGDEAIELGVALRPTLAVLDLSMPGCSGLEVAEKLIRQVPGVRILVLSMHAAAPILRQLQKAGVHAYLAKNEAPTKLVSAIERILEGEPFFASTSSGRQTLTWPEYVPVQFLLTSRELEVLRQLALGKSNKELAADLDMSVRTAESHHANIMAKLNVESLGELVRLAIRDNVA